MTTPDPHAALRRALKRCNLCELERLSGVPTRTLRRVKNGSGTVQAATIARIEPHLAGSKMARNEPLARATKAAATRALRSSAS